MPSDEDPDNIRIGPGRASRGSVTISSVTFSISGGGAGGATGDVWADDVRTETILGLPDSDVQGNIEELAGLLPDAPNRLAETSNSLNPSEFFDTSPDPVHGFYWDGSSNQERFLVQDTDIQTSIYFYPADRGVLAAVVGGTHVAALDLEAVFTEGAPEATSAPARVVGQNAYIAGSGTDGDVDDPGGSAITQNVSLAKRLPVLEDYALSNFPFLSTSDDPVYSDTYSLEFPAWQLAMGAITIDFQGQTGDLGPIKIRHYKSEADLVNAEQGDPYDAWAEADFAEVQDPSKAGLGFYNDADTSTSVSVDSFSWTPDDTTDSVETGSDRRFLSGILHYGPSDTYSMSMTASGLYSNSFLEEGVELREWDSDESAGVALNYSSYSGSGTSPGTSSSFSSSNRNITESRVAATNPGVWVSDPFGRTDVDDVGSDHFLWHNKTYGATPSGSRLTLETFDDEVTRYPATTNASDRFLPDGSTLNGSSYSFDSTAALADDELQVRGVVANSTTGRSPADTQGAELAMPDQNYGDGTFFPTTYDGSTSQRDYSSLPTTETRGYVRSFDVGGSRLEGVIRLVGLADAAHVFDAMEYQEGQSNSGHPDGLSLWVCPAGVPNQQWLDLGRDWEDALGALVGHTIVDSETVDLHYRLDNYPVEESGFYPVGVRVQVDPGTNEYTSGNLSIVRLEWNAAT